MRQVERRHKAVFGAAGLGTAQSWFWSRHKTGFGAVGLGSVQSRFWSRHKADLGAAGNKTGLVSRQVLHLLSKLQNWICPKTGQYKTCLESNTKIDCVCIYIWIFSLYIYFLDIYVSIYIICYFIIYIIHMCIKKIYIKIYIYIYIHTINLSICTCSISTFNLFSTEILIRMRNSSGSSFLVASVPLVSI